MHPFCVQLAYFVILSLVGHLALKISKPRTAGSFRPASLDIFFTSVSSVTVSSMSTMEMEVFSNTQLLIMTSLMFLGGEVLISVLGLYLSRSYFSKQQTKESRVTSNYHSPPKPTTFSGLEIDQKPPNVDLECNINSSDNDQSLKLNSIKCLAYVVFGYFLVVHITGSILVAMYISLVPSAREVLSSKGLKIQTFSLFTTASTFSNGGFVPTNESMVAFKKNSGLLLILIPQTLLGNTLFPSCLRLSIWVLEKITRKVEFRYILMNTREMGYGHLLSFAQSCLLAITVLGFIMVQFILFCSMEWNSGAMDDMNSYQKVMGALFQVVNSRHSGESVVDLSIISPATLVLFVVMMYLPPHTSFWPIKQQEEVVSGTDQKCKKQRKSLVHAYGNVGFSTGYSCKRQLEPDSLCKDACTGFVGRWSNKGKFILILVMFFGRLKKFSINGGKAWKLY
ncbi:unnamed protein product [Dovyalis caffra]|uniref:Sodium transporter HKT1 n=1 Tax=Dovyalis caffra TaxID=77055 RepID=A0AAV1S512_9ROSI|nr:unnamed protein product [Dovyalis caffra]